MSQKRESLLLKEREQARTHGACGWVMSVHQSAGVFQHSATPSAPQPRPGAPAALHLLAQEQWALVKLKHARLAAAGGEEQAKIMCAVALVVLCRKRMHDLQASAVSSRASAKDKHMGGKQRKINRQRRRKEAAARARVHAESAKVSQTRRNEKCVILRHQQARNPLDAHAIRRKDMKKSEIDRLGTSRAVVVGSMTMVL
jgi:hypothetical protein